MQVVDVYPDAYPFYGSLFGPGVFLGYGGYGYGRGFHPGRGGPRAGWAAAMAGAAGGVARSRMAVAQPQQGLSTVAARENERPKLISAGTRGKGHYRVLTR